MNASNQTLYHILAGEKLLSQEKRQMQESALAKNSRTMKRRFHF